MVSTESFETVSRMRETLAGAMRRKSFFVELRHRISKDAITPKLCEELLVRNHWFVAAFGDHRQVV